MYTWTKPVARPKISREYACVRLTEVQPLAPSIVSKYTQYTEKLEALSQTKRVLIEKIELLKLDRNKRSAPGGYRAPGAKKDTVLEEKNIQISKEENALIRLTEEMNRFVKENVRLVELICLQKNMEECYIKTKKLQEECHASWECMY